MKLQRQHFSPQLFKDPECWSGRSLELSTSRVTAQPSEPPVRGFWNEITVNLHNQWLNKFQAYP